ncbi:LmbE family N-acetylglucosaminyl deacetylase [Alkalihalobacillus xiaoxiensis]|uniref:LmbE family N-acetylglucosaminyl deacetylase n=1 Tax=Shouchella xiaoxiensis TaxID=766895 RepID=A0ABS2T1Y5_9BACI|nr:PIG-L deacetylase family protein [Shouchella xiaoxiensis]MBM7841271.1 LmbE family N-acetylglucosaminyl deacetylase [Shouchella xiaoxiensis]
MKTTKTQILFVGAHCGDVELAAGAIAHKYAKSGHQVTFLHLTAGEKGTPPHLSVDEYRAQKIKESEQAATILGVQTITLNYKDAELSVDEATINAVATLFRQLKPDLVVTHWTKSIHPDHAACPKIVEAAWLKAALPGFELNGLPPHGLKQMLHSENWEDPDYEPDIYVDVTAEFDTYLQAISAYWFVLHSTSFRYYDYYKALGITRGCLNRTGYAQTLKYRVGTNIHKGTTIPGFPV